MYGTTGVNYGYGACNVWGNTGTAIIAIAVLILIALSVIF